MQVLREWARLAKKAFRRRNYRKEKRTWQKKSNSFLTADEARQMYKPAYTLEKILEGVREAAAENQKMGGYDFERLPESVMRKLEELGYRIYSDGLGTVEINWG